MALPLPSFIFFFFYKSVAMFGLTIQEKAYTNRKYQKKQKQ